MLVAPEARNQTLDNIRTKKADERRALHAKIDALEAHIAALTD